MFLIHTLLIFVAIYIVSALLAETIFTSKIEQMLPAGVRVGLGYFLSLFYFVSAWLFLSMRQVWTFGLLLLGFYVYGKVFKGSLIPEWNGFKNLLKKHLKILGILLLYANLFFIPLHIAGHYGPFSERGGDITVYSDVAKRLTDFNLNAVGLKESASLKERLQRIKELSNQDYSDWYKAQGSDFLNPPNANYQTNKSAFNLQYNPIQYTPCAQFAFLEGETNHPVFFALLAFLYSLILVSAWGFFSPYGRIPAIISVLIIGGSNGFVSGFYNLYLLQAMSITILALTLAAVPFIRLFSMAGLKVYGFGSLFILMGYPHFMPIILPLLVVASINLFYKESGNPKISKTGNKNSLISNSLHYSPLIMFFSLCALEIYVGYKRALYFITGQFTSFLSNAQNQYAGKNVVVFSDQWSTFVFGFASQQHFFPLMDEHDDMKLLFMLGTRLGYLLFATSVLLFFSCKFIDSNKQKNKVMWHQVVIYAALITTICIYSMMSQTTLYTQAKGAQYLLLCLYFVMLLPLATLYKILGPIKLRNPFKNNENSKKIVFATNFFVCLLFVFSAFLWVPRAIYAYRIGHHKDKSTIIEPSFFSEARRIKAEDKNAFVLFEPRTSADVYFPNQSFAGYKMIPTRHLILSQFFPGDKPGTGHVVQKLPSDFVRPDDIPHLWYLTAVKKKDDQYIWKAKRIFRNKSPYIYFTGHNYQRNFMSRPRVNLTTLQSDNKDWGMFTRIRNGSAMIYLPPGGPYNLEIQLLNLHDNCLKEFKGVSKENNKKAETREFPSITNMNTQSYTITSFSHFEVSPSPRISLVSKCNQDYWFNARLNGKEMASSTQ